MSAGFTFERRVVSGNDDVEQASSGSMYINSSDLEFVDDGSNRQRVGIRFIGIDIPPGAVITNAYLQFQTDEVGSSATSLLIRGEDVNDAAAFTSATNSVSSRATTDASSAWTPAAWTTVGQAGLNQRTPNLSAIVQEVVSRPGWLAGNDMAFVITGSGRRTAEAFESGAATAPLLHIEYSLPFAPTLDLDGSAAGTGYAATFAENLGGVPIADLDAVIADVNSANMVRATATLANAQAGDQLVVNLSGLPAGISVSPSSTATNVILTGSATRADYQAALRQISFNNTSETPSATSRSINVIVNDGVANSIPAVATIAIDRAPDAVGDTAVTVVNTAVTTGNVLANDDQGDGPATVTAFDAVSARGGAVVNNGNGTFRYTPAAGFTGTDSFTYRITDVDGDRSTMATVAMTVAQSAPTTIERRVVSGNDDVEQGSSGSMYRNSTDLELTDDGSNRQTVGIRFTGIGIPQGAVITNAYLQFRTDEVGSSTTSLLIRGEDVNDAAGFTTATNNVSSRAMTDAFAAWVPAAWTSVGQAGLNQRTPNLSAIVQEIVARPGWLSGNDMAFVITGSGRRTAEAFESGAAIAPLLHIEYVLPTGTNAAPTLDLDASAAGTGYAATFTENLGGVPIADLDALITDANNANMASATVTLANAQAGDQLAVNLAGLPAGISVSPSSTATNVILTGSATTAAYQAALRQVSFNNGSETPNATGRVINVTVNDGLANSSPAVATIAIDRRPDAVGDIAATEVNTAVTTGNVLANDDQGDGPAAVTAFDAVSVQSGTVVNNANGTFTYIPATGFTGTDSFSYTISDADGDASTASVTLSVGGAGANDAPTNITLTASQPLTENAAGAVAGTLSVTDPDQGDTHTFSLSDSRFEVVGGQLQLRDDVRLDFERGAQVNLNVTATDAGGLSVTRPVAVSVGDVPEVRFAAFGDYGSNAGTPAVANLVDSLNVDFIITTGDNVYNSGPIDTQVGQFYSDYIGNYSGAYGPGSPTNRFFPSLGNHDYDDPAGGVNASAYFNYFTLPGNERYYDFEVGPVHFFAVNSNSEEPNGTSSTSAQAQWLQTGLANSDSPFNIVYFHHAAYSSAQHRSSTYMQWPFEQWGATAVLAGHDHSYERILRDDNSDGTVMPYFVTGLGGASRYNFTTPFVQGSAARYNTNWGTMLVQASDETITFDFLSVTGGGTLIDSYTIDVPGAAQLLASSDGVVAADLGNWDGLTGAAMKVALPQDGFLL